METTIPNNCNYFWAMAMWTGLRFRSLITSQFSSQLIFLQCLNWWSDLEMRIGHTSGLATIWFWQHQSHMTAGCEMSSIKFKSLTMTILWSYGSGKHWSETSSTRRKAMKAPQSDYSDGWLAQCQKTECWQCGCSQRHHMIRGQLTFSSESHCWALSYEMRMRCFKLPTSSVERYSQKWCNSWSSEVTGFSIRSKINSSQLLMNLAWFWSVLWSIKQ